MRYNRSYTAFSDTTTIVKEFQLELSNEATKYEEHEGQSITFPLSQNQKLMKDDYFADDGIHHARHQLILTGNEPFILASDLGNHRRFQYTTGIPAKSSGGYCSHYPWLANYTQDSTHVYIGTTGQLYFFNEFTTVDEFKEYLVEQYNTDNPVVVEFETTTETIEDYTSSQQQAYNNIKNLQLSEGINNIWVQAQEVNPKIYIEYSEGDTEIKTQENSNLLLGQEVVLHNEDLASVTPNYETDLLKSIMTGIEIQSSVEIIPKTTINFKWGLKVENDFEYLDYGKYKVYSTEKQENTQTYKIIAYDGMLASMKEYEPIQNIEYPCTLRNYLIQICNAINVKYTPTQFANYNNLLQSDPYATTDENDNKISLGYTYRDILDDIAEATGTNIIIKDRELFLKHFNETNELLSEDFIKTTLTEFSTYGPINAVVLSRSNSDNIYARDVDSIDKNGLYEIKITDNQILNGNNRDSYIDGIYNSLHGLTYTICDFTTCGIGYLEPLDIFSVKLGDKIYNNIIMLNDELVMRDGIIENIHNDEPNTSETDYTKADTTDLRQNQTTLIVDKQNQQIQGLITNTTENTQNISSLTQTVNGFDARIEQNTTDVNNTAQRTAQLSLDVAELRSEIGDVTDVTVVQEGYGTLQFENINNSEPIHVEIHAMSDKDIEFLYPSNNLFPSSNLYSKNRILRFTNTTTNEVFEYTIPDNLRYYNSTVYDKFILDYESETCQVIKNVGINADRSKYAVTTQRTRDFDYPLIELTQGNYTIQLVGYPNAYLKVRLMSQNMYTSQFATKVEMNSKITQKADEITSEVAENYYTKGEGNSLSTRVTQTEADITTEITDRQNGEEVLSNRITANANSISAEITNRQNADSTFTTQLQATDRNVSSIINEVYTNGIDSTSRIDQNAQNITTKVEQTTYNTKMSDIDGKFAGTKQSNLLTQINQNTENITTKVEKTTYNTKMSDIDGKFAGTKNSTLKSLIQQNANNITTKVSSTTYNNKMTDIDNKFAGRTQTTLSSQISQNADAIELKVDNSNYNHATIVAKVNDNTSSAKINADKVNISANDVLNILSGNTINMTTKNLEISSSYFQLDKYGRMSCSSADINGGKIILYPGDGNLNDFQLLGNNYKFMASPTHLDIGSKTNYEYFYMIDITEFNEPINLLSSGSNTTSVRASGISTPKINGQTPVSDKNLKKNIKDAEINAIDMIKQIKHRQFDWKDNDKHQSLGYIAQEVEKINPELIVTPEETGQGYYAMNILNLVALCTKAIQEHEETIEELKKEIKELKGEM